MTAPRYRKRLAKVHRRAATLGYCLAAAVASVSAAAVVDVPSYRVTHNNAPRRTLEKRRRLEQEYYRQLAARQQENVGEADTANARDSSSNNRRLPANASGGIHKKGREYEQTAVHKKGNKGEDESLDFMPIGSQFSNNDPSSSADDTPVATQNNNNKQDAKQDTSDPTLATNLRSFTRMGGIGYALPPTNRYPYMASLQLEGHGQTSGKFDIHMCGGILVAPDLIMTAAHCAQYSPPGTDETYQAFNGIEIGKSDLSEEGVPFDPYSLETYKLYYENLIPDTLHKHPDFNEDTYEHDVMLVKVFGKSRYPPVQIGRGGMDGDQVVVLGWGATSANSQKKYSDQLKSAEMDLMPYEECRNINVEVKDPVNDQTSILSLRDHVYKDMMCASSTNRYICYGDAGGPAIHQGNNNDEDVVYGILSWGYGCVNRDYPAVMTSVPDHYNWIRNKICDESSDPPEQYGCTSMTALSGGAKQTVTLKLKLDTMAVETGFVVEVRDTREIVAQRQTGYYKSEGNEIVLETMDLPKNQCYRLIMLDSYGDGFCCDMGGGPAVLYWGTEVSYYDGRVLAEVNGNFEFDNSKEFCLTSAANSIQVVPNEPPAPAPSPPPPTTPRTPRPTNRLVTPRPVAPPSPSTNHGFNGGQGGSDVTSGWSGPVTNPEFVYCTQFCSSSSHGMLCGNYECIHISNVATSDSQEEETETSEDEEEEDKVLTSTEFYVDDSEYFLTVQFQFDGNPDEISWVLYDLTSNEVQVFVDFDVYTKDEYGNQLLNIKVSMSGPEEGEKQYAFTVYDKNSNGLCCKYGDGYYKVFLGDPEDDLELLGDGEFEFSSSYYFTLFEMEGLDAELVTDSPTLVPSAEPTREPRRRPTKYPTRRPTKVPTKFPIEPPTADPITQKPTEIWERQRSENMDAIGARWSMRTNTSPGVFNDVGGDQGQFKVNSIRNAAATHHVSMTRSFVMGGIVLVCSFVLAIMQ